MDTNEENTINKNEIKQIVDDIKEDTEKMHENQPSIEMEVQNSATQHVLDSQQSMETQNVLEAKCYTPTNVLDNQESKVEGNVATNVMEETQRVLHNQQSIVEDKPESNEQEINKSETITESINKNEDTVANVEHDKQINKDALAEIGETVEIQQCEIIAPATEQSCNVPEKMNDIVDSESAPEQNIINNALSLLANYNSDSDMPVVESDSESVVEVSTNNYRQQVVEINSDTDTDSDSSEVSNNSNRLTKLRKTVNKKMAVNSDDDDEDDEENDNVNKKTNNRRQQPKVKGEMLLEDLPPIEDLHITVPEDECTELGRVHSIVDQLLLVSVLPNSILLDLDTVLFLDKGKRVLGAVFDVLGQVSDPLYCVRFNSNEQIKEKAIKIGDTVYVAPRTEYTQFVILSNLMKMRGSDASWENDVEPPPRYLDYSDDEQERLARASVRNKNRQVPIDVDEPHKRARNEDNDSDSDAISVMSCDTINSEPVGGRNRHQRGRGNWRGRSSGRVPQHYQHQPTHNSDSWHSNFYQYGNMPPPPYGPYGPSMPMQNMPTPNWQTYQRPGPSSEQNSSNGQNHS